jgi:hypothetical protein
MYSIVKPVTQKINVLNIESGNIIGILGNVSLICRNERKTEKRIQYFIATRQVVIDNYTGIFKNSTLSRGVK